MPGITAVIITKNEALHIGRCLDSLAGVADEIVVVDTFSEDATPEICQTKGVRFFQRAWEGYSEAKNYGNQQATYSHILWIDADEALSDELRASLLANKAALAGGYTFNRLNNYCGQWIRHGGWYPDRKLRVFPTGKATWKGDFVHEYLQADPELQVQHLQGDLLHFTYATVDEHWARATKYAQLGGQQIAASGKSNLWLKSMLSPAVRWVKGYLLKGGWRDGKAGWTIAKIAAWETREKYRAARIAQK